MVLLCHVILQDHGSEGLCNFMGGSSSWQVATLPNLVTMGIAVVEIQ